MNLLELIENKNKNKRSKEDKIVKSRIQGINKDKKQTNNFCVIESRNIKTSTSKYMFTVILYMSLASLSKIIFLQRGCRGRDRVVF